MIKSIIFDFGDVFINLDKAATLRELKKQGIDEFSPEMLNRNMEYEKGNFASEEFVQIYLNQFPDLSEENFRVCWNSVLMDFPEYRLDFIKKLSEEGKFLLILLSNTNEIHIDWVKENVPFFEEFRNCFDAFYLSQEINLRKPDTSIFDYVIKKHNLIPEETLFIDDTFENTEAAAKLGIKTWTIDPQKEDVVDLFRIKKEYFDN
ncbi:MAG TPA: HAD family phosphatase [Salinimicrobium sp.]|nr:HAD family phosphatase [Salinimicrobium sp.]